jgi:arylsulfatase A-like enzyme
MRTLFRAERPLMMSTSVSSTPKEQQPPGAVPARHRGSFLVYATLAFLLLRWGLRLLFVLRRPDVVESWEDALGGALHGAAYDLGFALAAGGFVSLIVRRSVRAGIVVALFLCVVMTVIAGAETEYFGFALSRYDSMFVAYAREWRVLRGSVSRNVSGTWLTLHGLLLLCAAGTLLGARRMSPARRSRAILALAAGVALCAGEVAVPRHPTTWFGTAAETEPLRTLANAVKETIWVRSRNPGADSLTAINELREFGNPFGAKHFLNEAVPFVHVGDMPPDVWGARPAQANVIVIMLEGMGSGWLSLAGGREGLTPALDKLASEGLFFRHFFANGAHTPRALLSVLCGMFPRPLGPPTFIAQPDIPLRCLPSILKDHGYETAFIHGGLQTFENRSRFLPRIGFETTKFFEEFEPPAPVFNAGWGATDAQTYEQALQWLDARDQTRPFMMTVLSISNHDPFDVPDPELRIEADPKYHWKNTIRYADREVGRFVEALRARGLLKDSYVFILGDHGLARSNTAPGEVRRFNAPILGRAGVPLIVLGPENVIPARPVDALASQVDVLPTVLDLLKLDVPNHAMGSSLGWTLQTPPRDLPVFIHDVYGGRVAIIERGLLDVYTLDDPGRRRPKGEVSVQSPWEDRDDGSMFVLDGAYAPPAVERRMADFVNAVITVYDTERWWSPRSGLASNGLAQRTR